MAIVGAGIGGLAAAHHLALRAAEAGFPLEIVVLEASGKAGGWLATEVCEGALLERGPDTMVTVKPAGLHLCERLGLGGRLVYKPAGRIDILHQGRLLPLPAGFALSGPARLRPLLGSPLLSWRGKLRALANAWSSSGASPGPVRRGRAEQGSEGREAPPDESVAAYMRRHFGDELYRRMCEPVVGGLFMADTEELSLAASFPRLAGREPAPAQRAPRPNQGGPSAPGSPRNAARPGNPPHPAATLEGGLGQIVPALLERLPAGSLRLGRRVLSLSREDGTEGGGYRLSLDDGDDLFADAVVVALPAPAASKLLANHDPRLAGALGGIAYAPAATVHLAWAEGAVTRPPDCHGFFVPRTAGSPVVAASFVSVKYPERTPAGQVVVRVFLGGALHPGVLDRSDGQLVQDSADFLAPLLGASQPPLWSQVWRLPSSMPQRKVGHPALAATLTAQLAAHPGLAFAGGPLGAYGLPDSITEGEAAAERALKRVGLTAAPARPTLKELLLAETPRAEIPVTTRSDRRRHPPTTLE